MREDIVIIGGGLAGSEAAWQAANRGAKVTLYEMRPKEQTAAHKTGYLAELVCSNSLGSGELQSAPGLLKEEMRRLTATSSRRRSRRPSRATRTSASCASRCRRSRPTAWRSWPRDP